MVTLKRNGMHRHSYFEALACGIPNERNRELWRAGARTRLRCNAHKTRYQMRGEFLTEGRPRASIAPGMSSMWQRQTVAETSAGIQSKRMHMRIDAKKALMEKLSKVLRKKLPCSKEERVSYENGKSYTFLHETSFVFDSSGSGRSR